jgi:hypothetical protein
MRGLWLRRTERAQDPIYSVYRAKRDCEPEKTYAWQLMLDIDQQSQETTCGRVIRYFQKTDYILSYISREHPSEVGIVCKGFLDTVDGAIYVAFDHAIDLGRHLGSEQVVRCKGRYLTTTQKHSR